MIRNYIKIAWRNLVKDKQFAILNLVGLSTGLACALLISFWIRDELLTDKHHEKDEHIYQVMQNVPQDNGIETTQSTAGLLAESLKTAFPEVEYAVPVIPASWFSSQGLIATDTVQLKAGGQFVGEDYFNIFSCNFLDGDKNKLFADKHAVAISNELAMKLFHTTNNVIGNTIEWKQNEFSGTYLIMGLFEKNPSHVSEKFDLLFNFDLFTEKRPEMSEWGNSDPRTYVLLKEDADIALFNAKINGFIATKETNSKSTLFVRKASDSYLYGQYSNGVQSGGRIQYVKLFSIIGIFILVIACINFMNLTTANASRRIKEVGIKKVIGVGRSTLVLQYLGESLLMSFLSLLLAIGIIVLALPAFNGITGKELSLYPEGSLMLGALLITFITGLFAGSYPAFYLSGFKPIAVLKGKIKTSMAEIFVRKGLVIFQFSLSVMAIVSALIIYRQMNYIQTKNLGYSRDNVIDFAIPFEMDAEKMSNAVTFLDELKNIPGVVDAASHYHNLTGEHGGVGDVEWPGKNPDHQVNFANLEVGYGFIETLGIQLKEGRHFSNNQNAFSEIIFNESAIKAMNIEDPIGKTVRLWGTERRIVGVTEDFNFESLYEKVKPCFIQAYPIMPNIIVKIKAGAERNTIAQIQEVYNTFHQGLAFDYRFLDQDYQALYAAENRVADLSTYFSGLAILICCLGLFGLAAFTAQRRQKEIGIRKIIGASVAHVVIMLSKDFLKLIVIAVFIAFPLVWLFMNIWLNAFAYRISIGAGVFVIAGTTIIFITMLTISFQAIKAAVANPVD